MCGGGPISGPAVSSATTNAPPVSEPTTLKVWRSVSSQNDLRSPLLRIIEAYAHESQTDSFPPGRVHRGYPMRPHAAQAAAGPGSSQGAEGDRIAQRVHRRDVMLVRVSRLRGHEVRRPPLERDLMGRAPRTLCRRM